MDSLNEDGLLKGLWHGAAAHQGQVVLIAAHLSLAACQLRSGRAARGRVFAFEATFLSRLAVLVEAAVLPAVALAPVVAPWVLLCCEVAPADGARLDWPLLPGMFIPGMLEWSICCWATANGAKPKIAKPMLARAALMLTRVMKFSP